jgi:very-short-patch-repair endonuclease
VNRSAGNPLPDEPWPLSARSLLSKREQLLYRRLIDLYPDHKILVQVALSQLINVDRNHPERESIRARYKQLVADFVLCRSDLSVVTVIELDDRTHAWPKRKAADARKNKALADAGIRLVRIPAGRLPSTDTLRALIDAGAVEEGTQEETVLSLVQTVDTYDEASMRAWRDDSSEESREVKRVAMRAAAVAILVVGGWFIFSQFLPAVVKQALQPLATSRARAASAPPNSIPVAPPRIPPAPVISGPNADELAWQKRVQLQAANALQRKKDLAWAAFYTPPAYCEHPADWAAQVECGNQYMRAKKRFEERWAESQGTAAQLALGDESVSGARR